MNTRVKISSVFVKFMFVFAMLIFSGSAVSGSGTGKVVQLHWWEGKWSLLVEHEKMSDLADVECGSAGWLSLQKSHTHFTQIYAMLLAAKTAGQQVKLITDGCAEGYAKLNHYGLKVHRLFYERLKVVTNSRLCVATRSL